MSHDQQPLPFSNQPLDFHQPIECGHGQLAAVLEKAKAAGFRATRMHVLRGGYRLEFERNHFGTISQPQKADGQPQEIFKESPF